MICTGATAVTADALRFKPWRCPANGGVNVLYCYLQVNGIECRYSGLVQEQSGSTETHTVASLAELARKSGIPLRPVSLTMDELTKCARPVIVHMDGTSPEQGAFLLILSMTDDSIHYINGPSATMHHMARDSFRRIWSGAALLPKTNRWKDVGWGSLGFGVGFVALLLCRLRSWRIFP